MRDRSQSNTKWGVRTKIVATQEGTGMNLPLRSGLSGDTLDSHGEIRSSNGTRNRRPSGSRRDAPGVVLALIMFAALGGWVTALLGIFAWGNPVVTAAGVIAAMVAATVLIIGSIALLFRLLNK